MPFGTYKSLEEVARAYQITMREEKFIQPIPSPINEYLQNRLELLLENAPVSVSEEAICEFLIAPILQEIWLSYRDSLMLWSHVSFGAEPPLAGYPDYFFSKHSPLGRVRDQPYVLFVEAKRDDFDAASAQCLSAMLAAQKINNHAEQTIFGGVSNGRVWALCQAGRPAFHPRFSCLHGEPPPGTVRRAPLPVRAVQATRPGGLAFHLERLHVQPCANAWRVGLRRLWHQGITHSE